AVFISWPAPFAFILVLCALALPFMSSFFAFFASLGAFVLAFISTFFPFTSAFMPSLSAFIWPISLFMASSARANELVPIRHNAANATTINLCTRHLLINGSYVQDHTSIARRSRLKRRTASLVCQADAQIRHGPFTHQQTSMWHVQKSSQNRLLDPRSSSVRCRKPQHQLNAPRLGQLDRDAGLRRRGFEQIRLLQQLHLTTGFFHIRKTFSPGCV